LIQFALLFGKRNSFVVINFILFGRTKLILCNLFVKMTPSLSTPRVWTPKSKEDLTPSPSIPHLPLLSIECLTKDIISLWNCEDKAIQSRKWQRLLHKFVPRETETGPRRILIRWQHTQTGRHPTCPEPQKYRNPPSPILTRIVCATVWNTALTLAMVSGIGRMDG